MQSVHALLLLLVAPVLSGSSTVVKLNNGVDMPTLAFGANVWDPATCKQATADALSAGFRFIWSSMLIGADCQAAQAQAIAVSSVPRKEIFLAGTVNTGDCSDEASCYDATKSAAEAQFTTLNVTTLDMLMLDYPSSGGCEGIQGQWRAFSELYKQKKVRSIAVSNFADDQLQCVVSNGTVVPVANQLSYSVGHGQDASVADNKKYGIVVQAYSPLGSGNLASDPMLQKIGKTHKKTAAQVALRWIVQRNATICTESTQLAYLQQDAAIFDFELSAQEMAQLNAHSR